MSSSRDKDKASVKQMQMFLSNIMGEQFWEGLCEIVTSEKPKIDMYDDGQMLTILAEAPSILSSEDIFIAAAPNRLNIKFISRDKYDQSKPGKRLRGECLYDTYDRTIDLPYPVDDKSIKAIYENGMLEITAQKIDENFENSVKVEFKK